MCSSVDLPAPDGPMMDTKSPSLISRLMRRNTNVLVGPCSKYFSTFWSVIIRLPVDSSALDFPHAKRRARHAGHVGHVGEPGEPVQAERRQAHDDGPGRRAELQAGTGDVNG